MENKTIAVFARFAAFALAACSLAGCGCNGGGEKAPVDPKAPVKERMADKEHVAALQKIVDEKRAMAGAMSEAKKKLDEAKAAGASAEELGRLEGALAALREDFENKERKAAALVAAKMRAQAEKAGRKISEKKGE